MTARPGAKRAGRNLKTGTRPGDYARIEDDFYPTIDPRVVPALCRNVVLRGPIWEPACGEGHITHVLQRFGFDVVSSDLRDRGFGETGVDFLEQADVPTAEVERPLNGGLTSELVEEACLSIATNPPYEQPLLDAFIEQGLKLTRKRRGMLAILGSSDLDYSSRRQRFFGLPCFSAEVVLLFRPLWIAETSGGGRQNFSWYVWDWQHNGPARKFYSDGG